MSFVYSRHFLTMAWQLPIFVVLVAIVNLYFNMASVVYRLRSKTVNWKWVLVSPFDNEETIL